MSSNQPILTNSTPINGLTAITANDIARNDAVELVDVDDTTMDLTGTNKGTNVEDIHNAFAKNATTLTPSGTTQTIDFDNGYYQILDLGSATGDVTLTLDNAVAGQVYILEVIQGATARDIVFPAAATMSADDTNWTAGSNTYDLSETDDAVDIFAIAYNGTDYRLTANRDFS